ncbi:Ti-type conjugative transfer relaxase TraA [Parasphingorhabdus sp.]|uniref:Ti-type conjugative transfer relaxase TraA n=1 Tax=Parasphingorhabdus sp. TaxID=2709688 RepID=UPI003296C057
MAVYHCSIKPISRSGGRSAVAAIAYRSGERLVNERDGMVHDFTKKQGIEHTEIVLPEGSSAEWARDRSVLWNAAEFAENRKDARVAREFEIALPHELSAEARLEAVRDFAADLANRYGVAVDFAIHAPHVEGDIRNFHAHVMMTTRRVEKSGLSEKTYIERENKWLLGQGLPASDMQIRDIRRSWEGIANEQLAREGFDIRIDHRSHLDRGLEIIPTEHMGVHATQLQRQGRAVDRTRLDEGSAKRNAELIREKPEEVLSLIAEEKSVFDRHDIARTLHRYLNDEPQAFQNAFASVMASPTLVQLQGERVDRETGEVTLARYSTRDMVSLESSMIESARRMHAARSHGVDQRHVRGAIERQDEALQRGAGDISARLSNEQRGAIAHITGRERIAAVVGFAGAGKSTMLAAAREAWERQGYRVHGAALSGKAAEGLEESSGIASRTLASWEMGWQNDRRQLGRGDVFVIDEAGMVGSRQLARFVGEAEARGAKIVLVGDHEQLQASGAGAPFRAVAEEVGHAELTEIRRQRHDWQREASVSFATHKTGEGLAAYRDHGDIHFAADRDQARSEIVRDYLADLDQRPQGSRVAMAHRRVDVRALNEGIRSELQERGSLSRGEDAGEVSVQTNDGKRDFAPGDRIVFLENNRDLGVKNGMLGTVERIEAGEGGDPPRIVAQLDGRDGECVRVDLETYKAIDHGYATTIHKNQGATVDRAYVLASATMDRHLTYVAMTRHRDGAQLYADMGEFGDRSSGRLVEHGKAPFEHRSGNAKSYFVTLENAKGERQTTWGVDLERAIGEAKPEIGETIGLRHEGSQTVRLPDGTQVQRNAWKVIEAQDLAYGQLEARLSRSGVKETTLDYSAAFAERRGIAETLGIRSEIDVARMERSAARDLSPAHYGANGERVRSQKDRSETVGRMVAQDRGSGEKKLADRAERTTEANAPSAGKQRRSLFDGLKLNARSKQERKPETRDIDQDRLAERLRRHSPFETAVDRYAQAFSAGQKQRGQGLPLLESQKREMQEAGRQLDQARSGSLELIRSAVQRDPQTALAMTERSGRDRVDHLVAGMERERAAVADPAVRADRFVERWQELKAEHRELRGRQETQARGRVASELRDLTKSLERDPQMEQALQKRSKDLGLDHIGQEKSLAKDLERQISREQKLDKSHGLEM